MTIQETPVYRFKYMDSNEPFKNLPTVTQSVAERLEQALTDAQIPPGNPDVNAILARLAKIETRRVVRVFRVSSSQPLTTNAKTALIWNQTEGTAGMHSLTTNPTRLYAPGAGLYEITATVLMSNVGGGFRSMCLRINGDSTNEQELSNSPVPSAQFFNAISGAATVRLAAGDYVELMPEVLNPASAVSAIHANPGLTNPGATRATMKFIPE